MWSVIGADGNEYGPVDERTLREWAMQGRVTPDSTVIGHDRMPTRAASLTWLFPPVAAGPMTAYPRGAVRPDLPPKSKLAAILLAVFLGSLGIHRFYLGDKTNGIWMLILGLPVGILTCGITAAIVQVWAFVDAIMIATGSLGDKDGAAVV